MKDENELRPGETVQLKSGGPRMTVIDIGKFTGQIWCRIVDADGQKEYSFPEPCLTTELVIRDQGQFS